MDNYCNWSAGAAYLLHLVSPSHQWRETRRRADASHKKLVLSYEDTTFIASQVIWIDETNSTDRAGRKNLLEKQSPAANVLISSACVAFIISLDALSIRSQEHVNICAQTVRLKYANAPLTHDYQRRLGLHSVSGQTNS